MSGVFDECGNPATDLLSPSMVLGAINNKIQHYRNEMNLTDEGWFLSHQTLTVSAGIEEYAINIADFSRPFFVETYDSSKPKNRRREVEMCRPQDRNVLRVNTDDFGTGVSLKHTARMFAFFNVGEPQPTVQVLPIPTQTAEYRIWYEAVVIDQPRLLDAPSFMPAFFPLIKAAACIHVLPFAGLDKELLATLLQIRMMEKQEYYTVFERYIQEIFHAQTTTISPAGASRRNRRTS